jgi:uncharacterized protein (TIGR00369 family)
LAQNRSSQLSRIEQAPFSKVLGVSIDSPAEGVARVKMPFDERMLNAGGIDAPIHGGAIASLIDIAACAAVWSLPTTAGSATISMTINYASPGIGTELVAEARVRRSGRRLATLAVEVRDSSGALIADGLVTYKVA